MIRGQFKEEGMRGLVTTLLAFGLVVTPVTARTSGPGDNDDKTSKPATGDKTADKTADKASDAKTAASTSTTATTPTTDATAKPAPSGIESELQAVRELLEAQAKQIQMQNDQMKSQQQKMEMMEEELRAANTPKDTSSAAAPESRANNYGSGVIGTADGQAPSADNPVAIHYKGITITPGGFLAAETVFRNKATGSDINTQLNGVPLPGQPGAQTTEFNASGRQSRFSALAEGKLASVTLRGYVESDFLGAGTTSNDNESNSYVLRIRQGWGQARFDSGWQVTGGQMWSLVTETKKGTDNLSEGMPLTIDPQYTVGFSWARQEALRVSKTFGEGTKLTLAASVEASNTTLTVHGNPTATIPATTNTVITDGVTTVNVPVTTTTVFNNFLVGQPGNASGLYNPIGTYAYNKTPDFIFKAALDPHFGHFEVFGIVSTFRDRVYPCFAAHGAISLTFPAGDGTNLPSVVAPAVDCTLTGSTNPTSGAFNDSRTGGGIGVNGRISIHKRLDVGIHVLGGDGIGRYGTAGLSDATTRPDGTLALIRSYQALGTLEFHATPKLDIYAYVGGEYAGRTTFNDGKTGYGNFARRDDGCSVETLPLAAPAAAINTTAVLGSNGFIPGALSNCDGDTRNILEGTLGFWYRFYNGPKGRMQFGMQYSYIDRNTWSGVGATAGSTADPHGIDNMVFTSMRYYLP
jgi:FKBP-type peptidyl-prolyl cis-trans isomerase